MKKETKSHKNLFNHFTIGDKGKITNKIQRFESSAKGKLHVLFDFDRTLTVNNQGDEVTTWHILRNHFSPEYQKRYDDLFSKYRPLEISGIMTNEDAQTWWEGILNLIRDSRVNMRNVELDFLARGSARPSTVELFQECEKYNIPTIILSAGVKDVISIWASHYDINPTLILSTDLVIGSDGIVIDWNKKSLIHILNKKEMGHSELTKLKESHPYIILVGDSIHDANMVEGDENVIRIRVIDRRTDETRDMDIERKESFKKFDLIIEDNSLAPILDLIKTVGR